MCVCMCVYVCMYVCELCVFVYIRVTTCLKLYIHIFDALQVVITGNIDILVVIETRLDASFEISQFCIVGFNEPYRLDRNRNGGGILIYVRQDIPTRLLKLHTFPSTHLIFVAQHSITYGVML